MVEQNIIQSFGMETGSHWENVFKAQQKTVDFESKIKNQFTNTPFSSDLDFVIYGSIARKECTEDSDVDWTLLIDGQADASHLNTAQNIRESIGDAGLKQPASTGLFGRTTISHDLIHNIGGQNDSNHNITRRMLLLLESTKIDLGPSKEVDGGTAYTRVLRGIINQYITHDSGLYSGRHAIPRFLLNDIVRFWRTMCVDFAYKQKEQGDIKWALRNIKLRMSRKLLFVKGLFMAFSQYSDNHKKNIDELKTSLEAMAFNTPLELILDMRNHFKLNKESLISLFCCYDSFLAILNDKGKREELENMKMEDINKTATFIEAREIGDRFQTALTRIFMKDDKTLQDLTIKYAVF